MSELSSASPPQIQTRVPRGYSTEAYSTVLPTEGGKGVLPPEGGEVGGRGERYQVEEEVGRGGMGKVFSVRDEDLNRRVAMKVLLKFDEEQVQRFVEEAQITSQLEHPNILPVHDFGVNGQGELFFTMKLVREHGTLADLIDRLREGDPQTSLSYTFERRVQVIQQVAYALSYAHARGVIHRDIKPENILVGPHGEVHVVDWGVAKLLSRTEVDLTEEERAQALEVRERRVGTGTEDGGIIGTLPYMAPEQVMGQNSTLSPATDVYALCAVLYEFLTLNYYLGHVNDDTTSLVSAVVHRKSPDAESLLDPTYGRVPRSLSRVCRRGLEKAQAKRFQSMDTLAAVLQEWLEGRAPMVCPGTTIQRAASGLIREIDRRPVVMPAVLITLGIVWVVWTVAATVGWWVS